MAPYQGFEGPVVTVWRNPNLGVASVRFAALANDGTELANKTVDIAWIVQKHFFQPRRNSSVWYDRLRFGWPPAQSLWCLL
jgi:hypothetical protein